MCALNLADGGTEIHSPGNHAYRVSPFRERFVIVFATVVPHTSPYLIVTSVAGATLHVRPLRSLRTHVFYVLFISIICFRLCIKFNQKLLCCTSLSRYIHTLSIHPGRAMVRKEGVLTDLPTGAALVWAVLRGVDDRDWIRQQDSPAVSGAHAVSRKRKR